MIDAMDWIVIVSSENATNITRVYGTTDEIIEHMNSLIESEANELDGNYDYILDPEVSDYDERVEASIVGFGMTINFVAVAWNSIQYRELKIGHKEKRSISL